MNKLLSGGFGLLLLVASAASLADGRDEHPHTAFADAFSALQTTRDLVYTELQQRHQQGPVKLRAVKARTSWLQRYARRDGSTLSYKNIKS